MSGVGAIDGMGEDGFGGWEGVEGRYFVGVARSEGESREGVLAIEGFVDVGDGL